MTAPAIAEPNGQWPNVAYSCQHTVVSLTGSCWALDPWHRQATCKLSKKDYSVLVDVDLPDKA
jgi:hypothetical protein